jgi:hypothetical protein
LSSLLPQFFKICDEFVIFDGIYGSELRGGMAWKGSAKEGYFAVSLVYGRI